MKNTECPNKAFWLEVDYIYIYIYVYFGRIFSFRHVELNAMLRSFFTNLIEHFSNFRMTVFMVLSRG